MKSNRKTVFLQPTRLAIISDSVTLSQTPAEATGPRTLHRTVCLFNTSAFSGTKLYRLVRGANVCGQFAQSRT